MMYNSKDNKKETKTKKGKKSYKELKSYLGNKYKWRTNTIANIVECSLIDKDDYKQVKVATLLDELKDNFCPKTSMQDVTHLLASEHFSTPYDPIKNYLESLEFSQDSEPDPFVELAKRIKLDNDTLEEYDRLVLSLKRWFVQSVKTVFTPFHAPKQMLVFQGKSGIGKTLFCLSFLPKPLRRYIDLCPHLDLANKDSKLALANSLVMVFDDIDDFFKEKKNRNNFKSFATIPLVNVRSPYARVAESKYRIASFLGTCNESTFLNGPTGSQRFIVFEIDKFWNKQKIAEAGESRMSIEEFDINKCWAYAKQLFDSGWNSEYSTEEMAKNEVINEKFKYNSPEFEVLLNWLEPAKKGGIKTDIF